MSARCFNKFDTCTQHGPVFNTMLAVRTDRMLCLCTVQAKQKSRAKSCAASSPTLFSAVIVTVVQQELGVGLFWPVLAYLGLSVAAWQFRQAQLGEHIPEDLTLYKGDSIGLELPVSLTVPMLPCLLVLPGLAARLGAAVKTSRRVKRKARNTVELRDFRGCFSCNTARSLLLKYQDRCARQAS